MEEYLQNTKSVTLTGFCDFFNDSLIQTQKIHLYHGSITPFPPLLANNIRSGTCGDYGARTIYLMRSLGMPVGIDFAPQWIDFRLPHSWNILIDENNKTHPFLGFDETIKQWGIQETFNCPKIFRKTFSIQENSLIMQNPDEVIPGMFRSSNFYDVSSEYFPVCDVSIVLNKIQSIRSNIAYLCVFNNTEWIPVHWAYVKNDRATFTDMGMGVIYLPIYYTHEGLLPAGNPFILDKMGEVHSIAPHSAQTETLSIERKYNTIRVQEYPKRMLHGSFQASNDRQFKNYDELYNINELPSLTWNTVYLKAKKKYRYVRYIGSTEQNFCNVAEIEFYSNKDGVLEKNEGEVIGTDGSFADKLNRMKENVFDGNVLTFFDAPSEYGSWVGLDLKRPKQIDLIRYLPRNDDNNIRIGDTYELMYWRENKWSSLGCKTADSNKLLYDNCPVGALFLLHNHTRGIEERIFLYEDGKQIWW